MFSLPFPYSQRPIASDRGHPSISDRKVVVMMVENDTEKFGHAHAPHARKPDNRCWLMAGLGEAVPT